LEFTNFDLDEFFGFGDDSNPLLMLIWILPIILFVFYGQRIQLQITSNEIKKNIRKLKQFKEDSRKELLDYINKELKPTSDPSKKLDMSKLVNSNSHSIKNSKFNHSFSLELVKNSSAW